MFKVAFPRNVPRWLHRLSDIAVYSYGSPRTVRGASSRENEKKKEFGCRPSTVREKGSWFYKVALYMVTPRWSRFLVQKSQSRYGC